MCRNQPVKVSAHFIVSLMRIYSENALVCIHYNGTGWIPVMIHFVIHKFVIHPKLSIKTKCLTVFSQHVWFHHHFISSNLVNSMIYKLYQIIKSMNIIYLSIAVSLTGGKLSHDSNCAGTIPRVDLLGGKGTITDRLHCYAIIKKTQAPLAILTWSILASVHTLLWTPTWHE